MLAFGYVKIKKNTDQKTPFRDLSRQKQNKTKKARAKNTCFGQLLAVLLKTKCQDATVFTMGQLFWVTILPFPLQTNITYNRNTQSPFFAQKKLKENMFPFAFSLFPQKKQKIAPFLIFFLFCSELFPLKKHQTAPFLIFFLFCSELFPQKNHQTAPFLFPQSSCTFFPSKTCTSRSFESFAT